MNQNIKVISKGNTPYYTSQGLSTKKLNCKCDECRCSSTSCPICKTQGCSSVTLSETLSLLSRLTYKAHLLSSRIQKHITLKYPITNEYITLDKIILLRDSILRYKNRLLRSSQLDNPCNCDKKIHKIFENAKSLLGVGYSVEKSYYYSQVTNVPELEDGLIIESAALNDWLVENPYCAPVDQWEKLAYHVCGTLGVDIEIEEIKCNLTFDIVKEQLPIDALSALSVGSLTKKYGINNIRTPDQCKVDWEILIEEIGCDLNFDVYLDLVNECNLSYDIVREVYECGLSFSTTSGKYELIGKNFTYDLADIDFKSPITTYSSLQLTSSQVKNKSVSKDKLNKFLSDYSLNVDQFLKLK